MKLLELVSVWNRLAEEMLAAALHIVLAWVMLCRGAGEAEILCVGSEPGTCHNWDLL